MQLCIAFEHADFRNDREQETGNRKQETGPVQQAAFSRAKGMYRMMYTATRLIRHGRDTYKTRRFHGSPDFVQELAIASCYAMMMGGLQACPNRREFSGR